MERDLDVKTQSGPGKKPPLDIDQETPATDTHRQSPLSSLQTPHTPSDNPWTQLGSSFGSSAPTPSLADEAVWRNGSQDEGLVLRLPGKTAAVVSSAAVSSWISVNGEYSPMPVINPKAQIRGQYFEGMNAGDNDDGPVFEETSEDQPEAQPQEPQQTLTAAGLFRQPTASAAGDPQVGATLPNLRGSLSID